MNSAAILAAAFPALLIVGVLLAPLFARRDSPSQRGASREAAPRPKGNQRREDSELAEVQPPSAAGGDRYFDKWSALQARFNEEAAEVNAASKDLITTAL